MGKTKNRRGTGVTGGSQNLNRTEDPYEGGLILEGLVCGDTHTEVQSQIYGGKVSRKGMGERKEWGFKISCSVREGR